MRLYLKMNSLYFVKIKLQVFIVYSFVALINASLVNQLLNVISYSFFECKK